MGGVQIRGHTGTNKLNVFFIANSILLFIQVCLNRYKHWPKHEEIIENELRFIWSQNKRIYTGCFWTWSNEFIPLKEIWYPRK